MSNVHRPSEGPPAQQHEEHHAHHDSEGGPSSFWKSKTLLVLIGFAAIATFLLLSEHRAHFLGALPYLLILACPLMHIFMHGGHGGHGDHQKEQHKSKSSAEGEQL